MTNRLSRKNLNRKPSLVKMLDENGSAGEGCDEGAVVGRDKATEASTTTAAANRAVG